MILDIIGIVIGLIAMGLIFSFKKDQQLNNIKIKTSMAKTDKSLIALQEEFTQYQVKTERKIAQLEKNLEHQSNRLNKQSESASKRMDQINKSIPSLIKQIIGHIEFAKPMNR